MAQAQPTLTPASPSVDRGDSRLLRITWVLSAALFLVCAFVIDGPLLIRRALHLQRGDAAADDAMLVVFSIVTLLLVAVLAIALVLTRRLLLRLHATYADLEERSSMISSFYARSPLRMGIVELDADRVLIVSHNDANIAYLRVAASVDRPVSLPDILPSEVASMWLVNARKSLAEDRPVTFEYTRDTHEGRRDFAITLAPMGVGKSGRARFSVVTRDMTEQRKAEGQLRIALARFRTVAEAAPVGIFQTALDGSSVFVNEKMREFAGAEAGTYTREQWHSVIHPEDRSRVLAEWNRSLEQRTEFGCEFRYLLPDNRETWVFAAATALRDAEGRIVGVVGTNMDITARKRTEDHIRDLSSLHEVVLESAAHAIIAVDVNNTVRLFNPAAERLLGWKAAEVIGIANPSLWHDPTDLFNVKAQEFGREIASRPLNAEQRTRMVDKGYFNARECVFIRKDGSRIDVNYSLTVLRDHEGRVNGFLGVALDVTEARRVRESLRQALVAEQRLVHRENMLRRELDHRVRNSLTGLMGLLSVYGRAGKSGIDVAEAMRGKILALNEVHDLISQAHRESLSLQQIIHRLLSALIPGERRSSISLDGAPVAIPASQAASFAIVIQELITNSLKHGAFACPEGQIRVQWNARDVHDGQGETLAPASSQTGVRLEFIWSERIPRETPKGEGTRVGHDLIQGLARSELRGEAIFVLDSGRFECRLVAHLDGPEDIQSSPKQNAAKPPANTSLAGGTAPPYAETHA